MSGGAWSNDQPRNLILPPGAGPADAQIVIGPDVPAALQTAWQNGANANAMVGSNLPANFPFTVIGAILFYDNGGTDYGYLALVDGNNGINHYAYIVTGNSNGAVHQAWSIINPAGGPTQTQNGSNISNDRLDIVNGLQILKTAIATVFGATATTQPLLIEVFGDTFSRLAVRADGRLDWGPGNAATDTTLYRAALGKLATDQLVANIAGSGETFHSFPYANSWADSGGATSPVKYRKTALNEVQIIGTARSPNPFNNVMGTLPAGYRPTNQQGIWAWTNEGSGQLITIGSSGALTMFGSTTITKDWWINGTISLDL